MNQKYIASERLYLFALVAMGVGVALILGGMLLALLREEYSALACAIAGAVSVRLGWYGGALGDRQDQ